MVSKHFLCGTCKLLNEQRHKHHHYDDIDEWSKNDKCSTAKDYYKSHVDIEIY